MIVARSLSRRVVSPAIVAKRSGPCAFCPARIRAGVDFISNVTPETLPEGEEPRELWMHAHCAKAYAGIINEHLEEEAAA